jgi:hypothetical protein
MGTHWMIFLTIGDLVSSSSSLFAAVVRGADLARPLRTKDLSVLVCSSRAVKPWDLLSRSCHLRDKMFTLRRASIRDVTNGLGGPRFRRSRDGFVAQLFFGSHPVLDIFSVFAAALKIQLMSPASDFFSRWFSESNHCNLLGCQDGAGAPTDLRMCDVDYLPFAETVIFICFGLDSSRFARCRDKTPL